MEKNVCRAGRHTPLSLILTGPVYTACHVERASFTESLSIPLQQIACVVSNGRQLSPEQEMLIDDVVDTSLIPEYYNPVISDPIKALVSYNHADAIIRNPSKYFTLWIQLGISYPGDYLQAFIDQTKGYWFPAPAALRTNEGISPNEIGLFLAASSAGVSFRSRSVKFFFKAS